MRRIAVIWLIVASASCGPNQQSIPTSEQPDPQVDRVEEEPARVEPVGFDMRHVRMRAAPDVVLQVEQLHGHLIARNRDVPVFDDLTSFYIAVESAELSMDAQSMTALVNRIFNYKGSPLSDLEVTLRDGQVEQKGKLHKGLSIPFSVDATVASDGGQIRLHPVKLRVAGIPAATMMRLFGLELDDVIKVRTGRGVTVRENDLFLEPSHMLPAPEVRGTVTKAWIAGDRIQLVLGQPNRAAKKVIVPDSGAENYIWFHGGRIRFGRLTMMDADLQLIDADERDPFDFYSDRYNDQLVAGYSRNTRAGALRTVMPDYADIARLPSGKLPDPAPHHPAHARTPELTPSPR